MDKSDSVIRILATTSNKEEAERIGKALVEEGLCACAQVYGPILSIYPWKGNVERDEEWVLSIKTLGDKYKACEAEITRLHSYEVPQILAFRAEAVSQPYLEWMKDWIRENEV